MNTVISQKHFYRLKAAMHDLIDRAGGIERGGAICGYSKSQVARWGSREQPDMMPLAAVLALEADTGMALVTRAMCAVNNIETSPQAALEAHVIGAFVSVSQQASGLAAEMAGAMADGVITGHEQRGIDERAAALDQSTEALRGAIAAQGGRALKVAG